MANKFITCAANCANEALPILDIDQCIDASSLLRSEVTDILFLSKKSATGTTNTLPSAITLAGIGALIDNTDTTGTKIKHIVVSGSLGKPQENKILTHKFKEVVKDRTFTLTAETMSITDNTYEFIRKLMCGSFDGYIWFATEDHIFGGVTTSDELITPQTVTGDFVFDKGLNAYQKGEIIITWKSISFPDRSLNFGL